MEAASGPAVADGAAAVALRPAVAFSCSPLTIVTS